MVIAIEGNRRAADLITDVATGVEPNLTIGARCRVGLEPSSANPDSRVDLFAGAGRRSR